MRQMILVKNLHPELIFLQRENFDPYGFFLLHTL